MLRMIYSIGHSNLAVDEFVDALRQHLIDVLVDVRSQPYSRYSPQFNRASLETHLEAAGVDYRFAGRHLGGRPEGAQFYDDEGHVRYHLVASEPSFLQGVERLIELAQDRRVAVMCSEEDPAHCHRFLLIGRVLRRRGVEMGHIRRVRGDLPPEKPKEPTFLQQDGEIDTYMATSQESLFGDRLDVEWRSSQPVSPSEPPGTSSNL